jgi:hypothetical protein
MFNVIKNIVMNNNTHDKNIDNNKINKTNNINSDSETNESYESNNINSENSVININIESNYSDKSNNSESDKSNNSDSDKSNNSNKSNNSESDKINKSDKTQLNNYEDVIYSKYIKSKVLVQVDNYKNINKQQIECKLVHYVINNEYNEIVNLLENGIKIYRSSIDNINSIKEFGCCNKKCNTYHHGNNDIRIIDV